MIERKNGIIIKRERNIKRMRIEKNKRRKAQEEFFFIIYLFYSLFTQGASL